MSDPMKAGDRSGSRTDTDSSLALVVSLVDWCLTLDSWMSISPWSGGQILRGSSSLVKLVPIGSNPD